MKLVIESDKPQTLLFVSKNYILSQMIKKYLKKYSLKIFSSSFFPKTELKSHSIYDYFISIDEQISPSQFKEIKCRTLPVLIFTKSKLYKQAKNRWKEKAKIIFIDKDINEDDVEKLVWFALTKSPQHTLELRGIKRKEKKKKTIKINLNLKKKILILVLLITIALTSFLPFLFISTLGLYQALHQTKIPPNIKEKITYVNIAEKLYKPVRPLYLFMGTAIFFDNLIEINKNSYSILDNLFKINQEISQLIPLILNKNKTPVQILLTKKRLNNLDQLIKQSLKVSNTTLQLISQNYLTKRYKKRFVLMIKMFKSFEELMEKKEYLLGENKPQTYLILLENNMELRPGGGFIGSFGVLKVADYSLKEIKIYDVYDADGQLKVHIDPPEAIKKYLHQPHFFLRDSAFSPDFPTNYKTAAKFLQKEMGFSNFSGGILITTTAVEKILNAFGNIYLTDFKENVNSDNFYIKAQIHSEHNFFPGSLQKKNFLNSLVQHLIINIDTADKIKLAKAIFTSLNEKQIVLYLKNKQLQKIIDSLFWSGKIIEPSCNSTRTNCVSNYIFPFSANLGVNKANFFVRKSIIFKSKITPKGDIYTFLTFHFINDSPNYVFPGGDYKNFFQIYIPQNTEIIEIKRDGEKIKYETENTENFKDIKIFFLLKPKESSEIKISYHLDEKISEGENVYQIVLQKQIGALNSDLIFDLELPPNIYIINQNFTPLAKGNEIIYNTLLSEDKIFYIQLKKQ